MQQILGLDLNSDIIICIIEQYSKPLNKILMTVSSSIEVRGLGVRWGQKKVHNPLTVVKWKSAKYTKTLLTEIIRHHLRPAHF